MHSARSKRLIKKLAKEYDLPEYKIRDVIDSHFAFTAFLLRNESDIKKGKFITIGIPFFGKFYVPIYNRERLRNHYENIRARK
jgi:hypothetical protein